MADSIPIVKVEPKDGYLETEWFIAASGSPTAVGRWATAWCGSGAG